MALTTSLGDVFSGFLGEDSRLVERVRFGAVGFDDPRALIGTCRRGTTSARGEGTSVGESIGSLSGDIRSVLSAIFHDAGSSALVSGLASSFGISGFGLDSDLDSVSGFFGGHEAGGIDPSGDIRSVLSFHAAGISALISGLSILVSFLVEFNLSESFFGSFRSTFHEAGISALVSGRSIFNSFRDTDEINFGFSFRVWEVDVNFGLAANGVLVFVLIARLAICCSSKSRVWGLGGNDLDKGDSSV